MQILYNYTNASTIWADRTAGLLEHANRTFFSPYANASNIMYEPACELINTCNYDQTSFKGYLARWLAKTSIVAPFTEPAIRALLVPSAQAAAQACSGDVDGSDSTCGGKWYIGGYDGVTGVGQELAALEVVQALLIGGAGPLLTAGDVKIEAAPTTTLVLPTSTPASSAAAKSSKVANAAAAGFSGLRDGGITVGVAGAFVAALTW